MATSRTPRAARSPRAARGGTAEPAAGINPWLVGGLAVAVTAGGVGVWLWNRRDLAAELIARQRELMASDEKLRGADLDAIVRDVDRLSPAEARTVRAALGAEWQRLKRERVDRYFAASPEERPALLDDDIARLQKYHRLVAKLNPMDMPDGPVWAPRGPRQPRGSGDPPKPTEAEQAQRELVALYDAARAARAKERGITLPQFR